MGLPVRFNNFRFKTFTDIGTGFGKKNECFSFVPLGTP